jgi:hypothetical protein
MCLQANCTSQLPLYFQWFARCLDFALTPPPVNHSISPESSDGFASVGTILPEGKAALLPGGLFSLWLGLFGGIWDYWAEGRITDPARAAIFA